MKAFDEIIHQAICEGVAVSLEPTRVSPTAYTATFRKGSFFETVTVDFESIYGDDSKRVEALALTEALCRLLTRPCRTVYDKHFGKGESDG